MTYIYIRKRNELQIEAVGAWEEAHFQKGRRWNSPAAFATLQMPDTFLPTFFISLMGCIYFGDLWTFTYQYLNTNGFFICNLEIIWASINLNIRWHQTQLLPWDYPYAYVTPGLHTYFSDISIRFLNSFFLCLSTVDALFNAPGLHCLCLCLC